VTELYQEHMADDVTGVQHRRVAQLDSLGHRPEYVDHRIAPSSDGDKAYLVSRVRCLDVPFSDDVDVADAQVTLIICGCDDWNYRRAAGLENGDTKPSEVTTCKHGLSEYKHLKAKSDNQQETL